MTMPDLKIIAAILSRLAHENQIADAVEDAIYEHNILTEAGQEAAYTDAIVTARNFFRNEGIEADESRLYKAAFMHIFSILRTERIDPQPFLARHSHLFCAHPDFFPNCSSCPGHTDHDFEGE
jgi:hypothetical protein